MRGMLGPRVFGIAKENMVISSGDGGGVGENGSAEENKAIRFKEGGFYPKGIFRSLRKDLWFRRRGEDVSFKKNLLYYCTNCTIQSLRDFDFRGQKKKFFLGN